MTACESCRHDNPPGLEFCEECGYYLRWELTAAHPVVTAPAPPPMSTPAIASPVRTSSRHEPRAGVAVTLGLPGEAVGGDDPIHVTAEAGGAAEIVALVRNRGELVDSYDIRVHGLPADAWTAAPARVHLNPLGARGEYEQAVTIRIHPPRSAAVPAGEHRIEVEAVPRGTGARPAHASATVTILPFGACAATLTPEVARGRLRGRFTVTAMNSGNAPLAVALSAEDGEQECRTKCEPAQLTIPPGQSASARVTVRPRRQIWIGRSRDRAVTVGLGDAVAAPLRAVYRQRSWLPWWVAVAVPLLAALAAAIFLMWPRTAAVPDLRGVKSAFEAQKRLQAAGLELDPTERTKRSREVPAGAILEQTPPAGEKVARGSKVTVLVALGSGRHKVPDVVGKTLADADAALAGHFKLGRWEPADAAPDAVIRAQWPEPGQRRPAGTPINVTLKSGTTPSPAAAPAAAGKPDAPAPGGAPAQAFAFDDGANLLLAEPGQDPRPLTTDGKATEPAFDPAGRRIAYMRWSGDSGQIWVFSLSAADYPGHALTDGAHDMHRPAFSPDGSAVAFTDHSDGSLCVAHASGDPQMRCERDARWSFERLAWQPDGALLAVARGRIADAGDGLVRFTMPAGVARAADWQPAPGDARLVAQMRNVQYVAVAPDGRQVAVTAGAPGAAGTVSLLVPAGDMLVPAPKPLQGVTACEVAFAADGRLTVSQGPCGGGTGQIELVEPSGERSEIGTGSSPAWRAEKGGAS